MVSWDYGLKCDLPIVFDAIKQPSLLFEVYYISHIESIMVHNYEPTNIENFL